MFWKSWPTPLLKKVYGRDPKSPQDIQSREIGSMSIFQSEKKRHAKIIGSFFISQTRRGKSAQNLVVVQFEMRFDGAWVRCPSHGEFVRGTDSILRKYEARRNLSPNPVAGSNSKLTPPPGKS